MESQRVGHDWAHQHQHTTWQSHCWVYILRSHGAKGHLQPVFPAARSVTAKTWRRPGNPTPEYIPREVTVQKDTCSTVCNSQHGGDLTIHRQTDGWRCDTYVQWKATQPLEKNEMMPFTATWVGLEMILLNKSDRDKHHTISLYMRNLEKITEMNLLTKQSHRLMVTKA